MKSSYHDTKGAEVTKIDQARRDDLRTTHFDVGNPAISNTGKTIMQGSYREPVNGQKGGFNHEKASDLKASHFKLGQEGVGDYHTQNTINYKWNQPKELPI